MTNNIKDFILALIKNIPEQQIKKLHASSYEYNTGVFRFARFAAMLKSVGYSVVITKDIEDSNNDK